MSTIAGIIATLVASHIGGAAAGGILAKLGLLGFGRKLSIARNALKVGKAIRKSYEADRSRQNQADLKRWLKQNDPTNESGLGKGVV